MRDAIRGYGVTGAEWISELRVQDPRTGVYLGSPSLLRLPSGVLLGSHEFFGPGSPLDRFGEEFLTLIYRSEDDGASWRSIVPIAGAFWSTLFLAGGMVYLLGTSAHDGHIVIRRSEDEGFTWSRPLSRSTGLLFRGGSGRRPPNYHCAPVPVLTHGGRIWRAFEENDEAAPFAAGFHARVISAPEEADLLDGRSWRMSEKLAYDQSSDPPEYGGRPQDPLDAIFPELAGGSPGWLEGNVVAGPDGTLWDILRVHAFPILNKAAMVRVDDGGRRLSFDPATGFIDLPGGGAKFTIRRDGETGMYWSLGNDMQRGDRPVFRNRLTAARSPDLKSWAKVRSLLEDDRSKDRLDSLRTTGFQYVDWQFDGPDIIYLARTAYGGAHNWHDANRITFGRLPGFRKLGEEGR